MKIIVLAIPHTKTHPDWQGCAFTGKVLKFLKMMSGRGHEIVHIGHRDSIVPEGVTNIAVTDDTTLNIAYGAEYLAGAWKTNGFAHYYDIRDYAHQTFTQGAIDYINAHADTNTLVLGFWGWGHRAIHDACPNCIFIEPGIGYPSAFARWRIYESHAIMNAMYGAKSIGTCDMDWYHRVIPNYFDPEDFVYSEDKTDTVLYLGRVYSGKGLDIIIQATERAKRKLIVAGQGTLAQMGYATTPSHVTEVGYADAEQRKMLLARASAVVVASGYLEPFAGVQVEAWLSGTPVITPDWAAFAELNVDGVTGYRCNTFRDFVTALKNVDKLDPVACLEHAQQFTLPNIAPRYERYFSDVLDVYNGDGWYTV